MKTIRAFFSIDLPQTLQNNVSHIIQQLHNNNQLFQCRWTAPEHFHITLQFLKEVETDDIASMIQNVRLELQKMKPFEIELTHIEGFPNQRHPRYITLIPSSNNQLIETAHCVGEGILKTDYSVETRGFRPHLTIGKIYKSPAQEVSFDKIDPFSIKFEVNEIIFHQSNPSRHGSCYTLLERVQLR